MIKKNTKLAINGGPKIRTRPFAFYNTIGKEEISAVNKVLKNGILSKFLGAWHENFYGGDQVRALESEWARYFGVKHAIAVNSATSGLIAAVGAAGIGPGDEVIVTPYSMCISATAPLFYGAIPVFADIEEEYFCLDPASIEKKITKKTKAIIVVDILGQAYDAEKINKIAKTHNLIVIEDCAQAPGGMYKGKYTGTLGDMGIFSLNYHKHIHCGEGGILVTNDDIIAERVRLIRNHAEAVVGPKGTDNLINMIGYNFRMTELEAAITREQLKKLKSLVDGRINNVKYISDKLSKIPFISPAKVRDNVKHVYYLQPLKFNMAIAGVHRDIFIDAVKAELMPIKKREAEGVWMNYGFRPLYLLPMFQNKICYGSSGYPFVSSLYNKNQDYSKGLCPVAERLHEEELFYHDYIKPCMTKKDLDDVIKSFYKVTENIDELRK